MFRRFRSNNKLVFALFFSFPLSPRLFPSFAFFSRFSLSFFLTLFVQFLRFSVFCFFVFMFCDCKQHRRFMVDWLSEVGEQLDLQVCVVEKRV